MVLAEGGAEVVGGTQSVWMFGAQAIAEFFPGLVEEVDSSAMIACVGARQRQIIHADECNSMIVAAVLLLLLEHRFQNRQGLVRQAGFTISDGEAVGGGEGVGMTGAEVIAPEALDLLQIRQGSIGSAGLRVGDGEKIRCRVDIEMVL